MKKMKFILALILFLAVSAQGVYTADQYVRAKAYFGSGNKTLDPMYLHMQDAANSGNLQAGTGSVFYVDSGVTTEGAGTSWTRAKDTLNEAIDLCVNDRGDFILVAQGHAESGTDADLWDADIAGITIIHLGNGASQGTYTFADIDTTVAIGAANVTVIGGRFLAGISEVVVGISVEAAGKNFTLFGAEFPEPTTSSWEFNIAIQLTAGSNDVTIIGCTAYSADATGADHWLNGGAGVVNRLTVADNTVYGEFAIAPIFSDQVDLECIIANNKVTNLTSGQLCIEFTGAATGDLINNVLSGDTYGAILDPGSMRCSGNTQTVGAGQAATDVPLIAGKTYARVGSTDFTSGTAAMFTVGGGRILITGLFGELAADASGTPGSMNIFNNVTAGVAWDRTFSTTVDVNAYAQGDLIRFENTMDEGVLNLDANKGAGQTLSWLASPGVIEQILSDTGTGGPVAWYMTFIPLEASVTVVP